MLEEVMPLECRWPAPLPAGNRLPEAFVDELSRTFRVLADPTRVRILHLLLRNGEQPVGEVAKDLGMSVAAVSNQLRKMADLGFLARSGRGNFVFYRVVDPCIGELLHRAYCLARDGKARRRRK